MAEDDTIAAFIPMEAISAGYGSEFRYYEKKWKEIKSGYTSFADNDIAFAKITPCFQNRKSVIFRGLPNGIGAGTTELKILRTYGETLNRWFVLYFLESPYFIDEAIFKGTANQQRIIVGYLENKLFPLPSLAEQERIVTKVRLVMPVIDKYSKSQEHLNKINTELNESLKKSILQEAIQGKLAPQITEEGTAQELLEQIKQEKQKLVKEGKLKKSALTDSVIFRGDDNKYYSTICKIVLFTHIYTYSPTFSLERRSNEQSTYLLFFKFFLVYFHDNKLFYDLQLLTSKSFTSILRTLAISLSVLRSG